MININHLFLRVLFSFSWIFVLIQHLFVIQGEIHRFVFLGVANKVQAFCYFFLIALFFFLKGRFKKPSNQIVLLIIFSFCLFLIGLALNNPSAVFTDFALIGMQIIFFYLGWVFFKELGNKDLIKKILNDSIFFALVIGVLFFSYGFEYQSPIIGFYALSIYAVLRFGKTFSIYFWIILIMMNILWAFGKQNLLISLIGLALIYFNGDVFNSRYINLRHLSNTFLRLVMLFPILISSVYILFFSDLEFGSVTKLLLLLDSLSFEIPINILFIYPELLYQVLDVSTASRLYELILVLDQNSKSILSIFLGQGFGGEIDLSSKNEFVGLEYTFETTRVAQTLPVFLLLKFGVIGTLFFIILFFSYLRRRIYSKNLFYPFLICFITSILAFSITIFHFIGFFWGAMIAQNNLREIKNP